MEKLFLGDMMKKVLKCLICLSLLDILIGLYYFTCLIMPKLQLYKSNDISIYDNSNNKIIQTHANKMGEYVSLKEMSPYLPIAFVAAEDHRFYNHYGYDLKGITRAFISTIFKKKTQGGSTITQQLARTLYLNNEKTFSRKLQEAILTARIETNYSKDEILEHYLNCIYLGHDLYGVAAAANYYFNKNCKDLTIDEAALLAGIANAPSLNAPDINYQAAIQRKNYVLKRMYQTKVINKDVLDMYIHSNPTISIYNQNYDSYLAFYQREIVKELKQLHLYTKKNLAIGFNVYTSIDKSVNDILYHTLQQYKPITNTQTAILILKPYTNKILAMAGSFNTKDEFNRATMSVRPIGSTIKPCIYYLALNYGLTPLSKFKSEETTFHIKGFGDYSPKNSSNTYPNKEITMIEALAVSDNIYSTKTLLFLGSNQLLQFLNLFGIKNSLAVPSSALGVSEMSLLQLASIYNTFASEGKYYQPKLIQKVTDKKGKLLYQAKNKGEQILDKTTTLVLNQLLRAPFDKNAKGYATPTLLNYQPKTIFGAKTGSTFSDSFVVGYNPQFCIAIWVGKDNNEYLHETSLSKQMFLSIANQLSTLQSSYWYQKGLFIDEVKINPLTGLKDKNGSIYWLKN